MLQKKIKNLFIYYFNTKKDDIKYDIKRLLFIELYELIIKYEIDLYEGTDVKCKIIGDKLDMEMNRAENEQKRNTKKLIESIKYWIFKGNLNNAATILNFIKKHKYFYDKKIDKELFLLTNKISFLAY